MVQDKCEPSQGTSRIKKVIGLCEGDRRSCRSHESYEQGSFDYMFHDAVPFWFSDLVLLIGW